jgi:(+)-trans-carveol dehydrogenase
MTARLHGTVAVVSGAARGQGRADAVALAREGASIVAFDIAAPLRFPMHPAATPADLEETARLVEAEKVPCMIEVLDARDLGGLLTLADRAHAEFGRIETVVVNHGIWTVAEHSWTLSEEHWQETLDVVLTGAWKVTRAFVPKIIEGGRGGAVILISSTMGEKAHPSSIAYTASKHGVLGLTRVLAWELGEHSIRVNTIMPGATGTPLAMEGESIERSAQWHPRFYATDRNLLPVDWIPPQSIANSVVFLASPDARHITGAVLPVDAGWSAF